MRSPADTGQGAGRLSEDLLHTSVCTDALVAASGLPVVDMPFVTVGGGLGSFVMVGRDPTGDGAVRSGQARPLVFGAGENVISDVHARIILRVWDVLVADCRSVYGTYVWVPGGAAWERLTAGQPVRLRSGSQVILAQRGFMFEPVNKR